MRTTNQTPLVGEACSAAPALYYCQALHYCTHTGCRRARSRELTAQGLIYAAIMAHDGLVRCRVAAGAHRFEAAAAAASAEEEVNPYGVP